jgi:hypothetical protein
MRGGLGADNHDGGSRNLRREPGHGSHKGTPRAVAGIPSEQAERGLASGWGSVQLARKRLLKYA